MTHKLEDFLVLTPTFKTLTTHRVTTDAVMFEVVVVEIAGFVRDGGCWRACCTRCVGFDVNGNQLFI
jgi:hypothetical protein